MQHAKAGRTLSTEPADKHWQTKLNLISKHATEDRKFKFNNLIHHLNEQNLTECFQSLAKDRASGVDGVTWEEYGTHLVYNIRQLVQRMKNNNYHPQPAKRVYIMKSNGKRRPLGIPALEDKIVQEGINRILTAIYEPGFLESSYGFRKGRGCHDALKALGNQCSGKPVNHIIDADIEGFFEHVDHEWLKTMLEEKITDGNFLRLIRRFLKAGYMEEMVMMQTEEGTPQGGIISPILSNIYLHYALDLWVEKRLKVNLMGYVEMVRYCDDFVLLVQYKEEAENAMTFLKERLSKFGLVLSGEKTRRIEFGRFSKENAEKRGEKPDTFNFLGFTHYVDKTRNGKFKVGRKTRKDKLNRSLKEFGEWLKGTRNRVSIEEIWKLIAQKMRGHIGYYGVSENSRGIGEYYNAAIKLVHKWMNRRSQRKSMTWKEFNQYLKRYPLPKPKIRHNFYANAVAR